MNDDTVWKRVPYQGGWLPVTIAELLHDRDATIAALREIVRVVAEADNSDSSICYQLCNVRWYGGETDAEEMEMRHDAPCIVEKARALLNLDA